MKKKFGYSVFTAVILLACLIPSAGMFLADGGEAGGNEVLSALPLLRDGTGELNGDYLTELAGYVEDNYFLRQRLVTAWSALNQRVLRTSIAGDVLLGRDGWLYFGDTLADYTGSETLDSAGLAAAAHNLALVSEYCDSQGAGFLFTIAPNKNSLYPQNMPDLPVFSNRRNADGLREALEREGVAYADLFAAFRGQDEVLYFAWDSHWNSKGAALAADGINAALGRRSDYFAGPFRAEADHLGDLYAMLYPTGERLETDQKYGGPLTFTYDAPIRSAENLTIMTSGGGQGSLLMFRDSFGNLLYPYLADSFASALFSRAPAYRLNLIGERGAEYVVAELVERNIPGLLENVPVMPAPAREREEAEALEGTVSLTAEPSQDMPGYILVRGRLPLTPDGGAAVCLRWEQGCCEAFRLLEDGFGLYVPETALESGGLELVFQAGGRAVCVPAM